MDKKILLKQILEYFYKKDEIPDNLNEMKKMYKKAVIDNKDKEIPENILLLEDKYLRVELINRKLTDGEKFNTININLDDKYKHGDKIALYEGKITDIYGDVLINPVNKDLDIDDNLFLAAGMRLRKKCLDVLDGKVLNSTEIIITRAFNLISDYVVHVCVPSTEDIDEYRTELGMCYFNVLECSNNNIAKTIILEDISKNLDNGKELLVNSIMEYLDRKECLLEKIIIVANKNTFDDYVSILEQYKETTE